MPRKLRSMSGNQQFANAYVALIALFWNSLEHIDTGLAAADEDWQDLHLPLQLLRMELLQLGERSRHSAGTALLSSEQNVVMQRFVARLLGWLDIDALAPREVAVLRVRSAQNWLFDEARELQREVETDLRSRHG